jgi:hypothetical protein
LGWLAEVVKRDDGGMWGWGEKRRRKRLLLHIQLVSSRIFRGYFFKLKTEVEKPSKMRGDVKTSPQALIEKRGDVRNMT